jgi:hypothetical protein
MKTIYLVPCVSQKAVISMPAEDLYESDWFRKARRYVLSQMRSGDEWFILSAEHYLLHPAREVAPYDTTLIRMSKSDRTSWGKVVLDQLLKRLSSEDKVVVLAGARYREALVPAVTAAGYAVSVPMNRLPIGKQKAWLLQHIQKREPGCESA